MFRGLRKSGSLTLTTEVQRSFRRPVYSSGEPGEVACCKSAGNRSADRRESPTEARRFLGELDLYKLEISLLETTDGNGSDYQEIHNCVPDHEGTRHGKRGERRHSERAGQWRLHLKGSPAPK